jgi:RNA polymerase sigma-70 factor (ECF subfamily)
VCLDILRSRTSRREESLGATNPSGKADPEQEALLADSVGLALLVVLERLTPAERLAFVLHDVFAVSFDEIAPIVGRTPAAARQLASRARRRVQGPAAAPGAALAEQRDLVGAFLSALRAGDVDGLVAVLDPGFALHTDQAAAIPGAPEVQGAREWAKQAIRFARGAASARPALIDGAVGVIVAPRGRLFRVVRLTFTNGKIARADVVGDPATLRALDLAVL